jgi:hypothetical protein
MNPPMPHTLNQKLQDDVLVDIQLMLDNFSLASLLAGLLMLYKTAELPPPSATVLLRGQGRSATIPGENCGFFVTPVIQMAILDCRRSLEFFGLTCDEKAKRLRQIEARRYATDLGIENFGLSQVEPEDFLRMTAPAITDPVEPMLVGIHGFGNKQLAHFTVSQNDVMLPSIRNVSPVMLEAYNHFLFDALGRPRPRVQPSDSLFA